jgi:hypothetical protein
MAPTRSSSGCDVVVVSAVDAAAVEPVPDAVLSSGTVEDRPDTWNALTALFKTDG